MLSVVSDSSVSVTTEQAIVSCILTFLMTVAGTETYIQVDMATKYKKNH